MRVGRAGQGWEGLEREIQAEKAAALLRISRTLEQLIEELHRPQAAESRRRLRREALLYRWYLEVQREAVGLTRHETLDELYVIPPPVTE